MAAGLAALLATIAVIVAGVGWLYLLFRLSLFGAGPRVAAALPLEELASRGAQPLARVAVAWIPVGAVTMLVLGALTRRPPLARVAIAGLLTALIAFPSTVSLEALTRNERVSSHLPHAFERAGSWVAVAFVLIGAAATAALERWQRRRPGAAPASTDVGAGGPAAA